MAVVPKYVAISSEKVSSLNMVADYLAKLKSTSFEDQEAVCQEICTASLVSMLQKWFDDRQPVYPPPSEVITLIAELSKLAAARQILQPLLPSLVTVLKDRDCDEKTIHETYRAVGNLCFENDVSRQIILEHGGIPILVQTLRKIVPGRLLSDNGLQCDTMINKAVGCLTNVVNDHTACQEVLLQCGYLDILVDILADDSLASCHQSMVVQLTMLADASIDACQLIAKLPVTSRLLSLLKTADSEDSIEELLDLLSAMMISEDSVVALVQLGCVQTLLNLIENTNVAESVAVYAGNILVEVTAGANLQQGIQTQFLVSKAAQWLIDFKNKPPLLTTAALVIGNLSRSNLACERNCQIKPDNLRCIPEILLDILDESVDHSSLAAKPDGGDDRPKIDLVLQLQYALLSAVKNLCTPEETRTKMYLLALPPLRKVIDYFSLRNISSQEIPVVAKTLALLRMFVKISAVTASSPENSCFDERKLIQFCFKWCLASGGLVEEGLKLLCAMLKVSLKQPRSVEMLVDCGLISFLCQLMNSDLQSRVGAILFLSIILEIDNVTSILVKELCESDFFPRLRDLSSTPSLRPDTQKILLLLLQKLSLNEDLKKRIEETDFRVLLKICLKDPANPELCTLAEEISNL